jgi:hypothetical protein
MNARRETAEMPDMTGNCSGPQGTHQRSGLGSSHPQAGFLEHLEVTHRDGVYRGFAVDVYDKELGGE